MPLKANATRGRMPRGIFPHAHCARQTHSAGRFVVNRIVAWVWCVQLSVNTSGDAQLPVRDARTISMCVHAQQRR